MLRPQKRSILVLGSRNPAVLFVAAAVVGGSMLAAWSVSQRIIGGTSPVLALWTVTPLDVPAAQARVTTAFDINSTLRSAPADAPVQHAGVIGCTYVLTDGHRCD